VTHIDETRAVEPGSAPDPRRQQVHDHYGVHVGRMDADGTVRTHTGIRVGRTRQNT